MLPINRNDFIFGETSLPEAATPLEEIRNRAICNCPEHSDLSFFQKHKLEKKPEKSFISQLAGKIYECWISLLSPKNAVLNLAKKGASQKTIDAKFPCLHPLIHMEAAKAYLTYVLDNYTLPEKFPDLIKAVKKELNKQYPGLRGEFSETFLMNEIEKQFSTLGSQRVKQSYLTYCLAEEILNGQILPHIDHLKRLGPDYKHVVDEQIEMIFKAFKYFDEENSFNGAKVMMQVLTKWNENPAAQEAFHRVEKELSPSFKMKLKNELETEKVKELLQKGAYEDLKTVYKSCSASEKERMRSIVILLSRDSSIDLKLQVRALGVLEDMAEIIGPVKEKTYSAHAMVPGINQSVIHEAVGYPGTVNLGQCEVDYSRSPCFFIDNKFYFFPDFKEFYPMVEKKYGAYAAKMITQGKFGAAQFFVFDELNPLSFTRHIPGNRMVSGNDFMTYAIEQKGDMVQFSFKVCYRILETEKPENGPLYYVPVEQTICIPFEELKKKKIDETKVKASIEIHASVATLNEAYKALNIRTITPMNVPKIIDDYNKMGAAKRGDFLDQIAILLVERGLSEAEDMENATLPNIKKVLAAIPARSMLYQTLKSKIDKRIFPYSLE